jgi:hypothetical protein
MRARGTPDRLVRLSIDKHMTIGRASFAAALVTLSACVFAWDDFDPRNASNPSAGGNGGGGMGGSAGMGGSDGGAGNFGGGQTFTQIQPVEALEGDADDDDPTFTADLLELYFNSSRSGAYDIWMSTRSDVGEPWGAPVAAASFNSPEQETNPVIAPDGLTFWVSSRRDGQSNHDIYVSTRPDRQSNWTALMPVPELTDTVVNEKVGAVSSDNLTMLFTRDSDMYVTQRMDTAAPWGALFPIDELNTLAFEGEAWLSPQALELFFTSNIEGNDGIYQTTRTTVSAPWSAAVPVLSLNTAGPDGDPWLAPDMSYVMFARAVDGAGRQIYEAILR